MKKKIELSILIIILVIPLLLIGYWHFLNNKYPSGDSALHFYTTQLLSLKITQFKFAEIIRYLIYQNPVPTALPILAIPYYLILGKSILLTVTLFTITFFVLILIFLIRFLSRFLNFSNAVLVTVSTLMLPSIFLDATIFSKEILFIFFPLAALFYFSEVVKTGGRRSYILLGVSIGLAGLITPVLTSLVFFIPGVYWLFLSLKNKIAGGRSIIYTVVIAVLMIFSWVVLTWDLTMIWISAGIGQLSYGGPHYGLSYCESVWETIKKLGGIIQLVPLVMILIGLFLKRSRKQLADYLNKNKIIFVTMILLSLLPILIGSLTNAKSPRYYQYSMMVFYLLSLIIFFEVSYLKDIGKKIVITAIVLLQVWYWSDVTFLGSNNKIMNLVMRNYTNIYPKDAQKPYHTDHPSKLFWDKFVKKVDVKCPKILMVHFTKAAYIFTMMDHAQMNVYSMDEGNSCWVFDVLNKRKFDKISPDKLRDKYNYILFGFDDDPPSNQKDLSFNTIYQRENVLLLGGQLYKIYRNSSYKKYNMKFIDEFSDDLSSNVGKIVLIKL